MFRRLVLIIFIVLLTICCTSSTHQPLSFLSIGGLERSGTTLLYNLLAQHPSILSQCVNNAAPWACEGKYFQNIIYSGFAESGVQCIEPSYYTRIRHDEKVAANLDNKNALLDQWSHLWLSEHDLRMRIKQGLAPAKSDSPPPPIAIKPNLDKVDEHARQRAFSHYRYLMEKTPEDLLQTRALDALMPLPSKFIMMVRNPYATAKAEEKAIPPTYRHQGTSRTVLNWLECHDVFVSDLNYFASRRASTAPLIVRFEDLLSNPVSTLHTVLAFLELPLDTLKYYQFLQRAQLMLPTKFRQNHSQRYFDEQEIATLYAQNQTLVKRARRYGYELDFHSSSPSISPPKCTINDQFCQNIAATKHTTHTCTLLSIEDGTLERATTKAIALHPRLLVMVIVDQTQMLENFLCHWNALYLPYTRLIVAMPNEHPHTFHLVSDACIPITHDSPDMLVQHLLEQHNINLLVVSASSAFLGIPFPTIERHVAHHLNSVQAFGPSLIYVPSHDAQQFLTKENRKTLAQYQLPKINSTHHAAFQNFFPLESSKKDIALVVPINTPDVWQRPLCTNINRGLKQ